MNSASYSQVTSFDAIGTHWQISVDGLHERDWHILRGKIRERIETFDANYSRFRSDSWVSQIAARAGDYPVPNDFAPMYQLYEKLYRATGGKVTPLIGNLLVSAGYDATYSLKPTTLATVPRWEDVLSFDGTTLKTTEPVLLDFGAGGKGYLIDIVSKIIQDAGVTEFLVDAGGDIRHQSISQIPMRIGLEHPSDFSQAIGLASLCNQSIAGSAGNRRKWGAFHHIMDPQNQTSVSAIIAVWVVAKTTLIADCLSTSLFFVSPETLSDMAEFSYVIVYTTLSVEYSKNFPGEVF